MEQRSWVLTVGFVMAAMALGLGRGGLPEGETKPQAPQVTAKPSEGAPASPAAAPREGPSRWRETLKLYDQILAISPDPANPDPVSSDPITPSQVAQRAEQAGYSLDFLIALIPDPVDSGLSYRSTESLEAIQRGFAESGCLFDRHWFPWAGEPARKQAFRDEPGVLFFRKVDERDRRLTAVFLVGETAKSGIQKKPFLEALSFVDEMRRITGAAGPIRILGPTFSGSVESLRVSLLRWLGRSAAPLEASAPPSPEQPRIRMVSGTATAPGISFGEALEDAVTFERVILTDDLLQEKAFAFLEDRLGWRREHMALLTELDTAYGKPFRVRGSDEAGIRVYEFPSHLSQIRAAREKQGLTGRPQEQPAMTDPSRLSLALSLAEEETPVDVLPQLGPLTRASDDLALASVLQTLSREGTRYVGVVATDLRDRVFLVDRVRSYIPDAVVFTFDNHLLYAHPRLSRSLAGTLSLTSFPLYMPSTGGQELQFRRQITSELQQGTLLAVRRLLGEPVQPVHAWVVAVGNGALWPIARLGDGQTAQPFTIAGTEKVAFKWITASVVIALLAFWLWTTVRSLRAVEARRAPDAIPGMRWLPLAAMGTLLIACGVLLVFYALPLLSRAGFRRDVLSEDGLLWFLNLIALLLLYAVLAAACGMLRSPDRRHGRRWALAGIAGGLLLLFVLYQAILSLWIVPEGAELFYARAGDFAGGLSPLVSLGLLLAAVFSWAFLALRRRRMSLLQETRWPLAPDLGGEPLSTCGRQGVEIDRILWSWSPGGWFWLGLLFALALPARRLIEGIQPITEPAAYGWVFLALVALGFTLGALAFYRFIVLWKELERVLDLMCHSWLLGAFRQSAPFFDWKPLRSFGWRIPRHKMTLLSFEAQKGLTRRGVRGADGAPLVSNPELDAALGAMVQAEQAGDLEAEVRVRQELQARLAASVQTLERARPRLPSGDVSTEIDRFVALRVVSWIRYVFAHLRFSLISAMACSLFVLVGVSAYAFQPKRYVSFGLWVFLLAGSLLALRVFVRMDRNTVLSAIGGTEAGKVSFDRTFFSNLLTYGGIPVLGVVLTQFPAVGSLLGDWLQPLLRLLGS
jgi:hypothetical protein